MGAPGARPARRPSQGARRSWRTASGLLSADVCARGIARAGRPSVQVTTLGALQRGNVVTRDGERWVVVDSLMREDRAEGRPDGRRLALARLGLRTRSSGPGPRTTGRTRRSSAPSSPPSSPSTSPPSRSKGLPVARQPSTSPPRDDDQHSRSSPSSRHPRARTPTRLRGREGNSSCAVFLAIGRRHHRGDVTSSAKASGSSPQCCSSSPTSASRQLRLLRLAAATHRASRRAGPRVERGLRARLPGRTAAGGEPGVDPEARRGSGLPDAGVATRLSFVSVAIWWLGFSIPMFRRVPEAGRAGPGSACRRRAR